MSGRISAIDALQSDPRIVYVGSAGGGVWKSKNAGVTFKPVFDKYTQSIGAVRIDQNHPDTVWVGTGEPWTRNSVSVGNGVFVSYDGGDTWKEKGLENTERISRIVLNPENSNIVYVAALGHLWNANEERGVFKSIDGGNTWKKYCMLMTILAVQTLPLIRKTRIFYTQECGISEGILILLIREVPEVDCISRKMAVKHGKNYEGFTKNNSWQNCSQYFTSLPGKSLCANRI